MSEESPIKRWSYSSWATYNDCGARFKFRYIDKLPEPPSAAMARGTDIHTIAEYWLDGKLKGPLPPKLKKLEAEFKGLKKLKPQVEAWWGVDEKWQVKQEESWLVGKVDAHVFHENVLTVIDHKTGKIYADKHEKQASLYAAIGAAFYPKAESVRAEFWYLDQGTVLTWEWQPKEVKKLQKAWTERGRDVMSAKRLDARPSFYCKWCPYSKGVGGPCQKA